MRCRILRSSPLSSAQGYVRAVHNTCVYNNKGYYQITIRGVIETLLITKAYTCNAPRNARVGGAYTRIRREMYE